MHWPCILLRSFNRDKYLHLPTRIAVDSRNSRGTQSQTFQPLSPRRNLRENSPFTRWIVTTEILKKKKKNLQLLKPTVFKRSNISRRNVPYPCGLRSMSNPDVVRSDEPYVRILANKKKSGKGKRRREKSQEITRKERNIERNTSSSRALLLLDRAS